MTEEVKAPTKVAPVPLRIPGFSVGVRPGSAVRRLVMNSPICPYSQRKYTKDQWGAMVPVDEGTQNCQLAKGQWWIDCQARGHDPYFTTKVRYTIEDVYAVDEAGREIKTGEQRIAHREYRPNLVTVPLNRRLNNGRGVLDSMEKKGRRRLRDAISEHSPAGYIEVCQFRNCQEVTNPKYHSIPLGDYCSRQHFQLSAANEKSIGLVVLGHGLNVGFEEKNAHERDQQLAQATWLRTDED